jgi:hypothetical protein
VKYGHPAQRALVKTYSEFLRAQFTHAIEKRQIKAHDVFSKKRVGIPTMNPRVLE